jgi:hypothetical protein
MHLVRQLPCHGSETGSIPVRTAACALVVEPRQTHQPQKLALDTSMRVRLSPGALLLVAIAPAASVRPSSVMAKRVFERRDGQLFDRYELPSGKQCTAQFSAQRLGEPLPEEQLHAARESASQQLDRRSGAYVLRAEEKHADTLEALLAGLSAGNIRAPMTLLAYLDDPRVRPALVEATRLARPESLANVAQVLGIVGGPGAREVLRQRMEALLAAPETFEDSTFMNFTAGSAATVAKSLLGLDAEDIAAANCLCRLLTHPCANNRSNAAGCAAAAYRHGLKTEAMQRLAAALQPLVHNQDDELFLSAIEGLKALEPRAVIDRCVRLLDGEVNEPYSRAAIILVGLPLWESADVLPRLIEWLSGHRTHRVVLPIAGALGSLVPAELRLDLLRRALADDSPSQRWTAIRLLGSLPLGQRVELVSIAVADEPDAALKNALTAAIATT